MTRAFVPPMVRWMTALSAAAIVAAGGQATALRDTSCAACKDFYAYANAPQTTAKLSGALRQLGSSTDRAQRQADRLDKIVTSAVADAHAKRVAPMSDRFRLAAYYEACVDTARLEHLGSRPLDPYLREIDEVHTPEQLMRTLGELKRDFGAGFLGLGTTADANDARTNITAIAFFGGLGLPSRNFYVQDDARFAAIRAEYEGHIRAMFELLGQSADSARVDAATALRLETEIARRQPSLEVARDPRARDFVITPADLDTLTPHIPWSAFLRATDAPAINRLNARYPTALQALDSLIAAAPATDWRPLLRWELVNAAATALSSSFNRQRADIAALAGTPDTGTTRAARCVEEARAAVPDAVAREYVARYFSPAAQREARAVVEDIVATLRDRLHGSSWMSDSTRSTALMKLDSLVRNVGYPDHWQTYSDLPVARDDYFRNRVSLSRWRATRDWRQLDSTNDRGSWKSSAATPRGTYTPPANQITTTAASLQPPIFVPAGDVATNYGAIGAVIAHELTHGFDNIGGRYDASGNLRNWWTKADADRQASQMQQLVEQFNGYAIDSSRQVNGRSTVGENLADLGGLEIAYAAMQRALTPQSRRRLGGFTAEQRFFLAYARLLKEQETQNTDLDPSNATHAPPRWRVDGPLSNMPEFARAWSCKEGDSMVRATRVQIW